MPKTPINWIIEDWNKNNNIISRNVKLNVSDAKHVSNRSNLYLVNTAAGQRKRIYYLRVGTNKNLSCKANLKTVKFPQS